MTTGIKGFRHIKSLLAAIALLLAVPTFSYAADTASTEASAKAPEGKEKFNAGDMIIQHVSDAHSWHIAGNFSIPLPVILYSKDRGLMIFSSAKLKGGVIYKGLEKDPNSQNGFKESGVHIVVANPDGSINQAETDKTKR